MRLISLFRLLFIINGFVMADMSVISIKDINDNSVIVKSSEVSKIKKLVQNQFIKVKGNGTSNIQIILNNRTHKIEHTVIYSKYGDLKFKKSYHEFISNLYDLKLDEVNVDNETLKFQFDLKVTEKEEKNYSVYKNEKNNIYQKYINYLLKKKGYNKSEIRELLDSKRRTVTKSMLLGIYYDYLNKNPEKAKDFYTLVIENKFDRFVRSEEGLFLADFLIRDGKDELVLKLFPKFSCQFFERREMNECLYFRAKALYDLNNSDYIIPLNQVKDILVPANRLFKEIKNKRGIV